jgi:hypothetical protein
MENLNQDNQSSSWNLNPERLKYEAEVLTICQWHKVC